VTELGRRVYGLGALALGLIGLVWGDFALVWQPVPAGVPDRALLAYLTAAILVLGGLAVSVRRTAAAGALTLAALYALGVALLHIPHVIAHPFVWGAWGGVAEQTALAAGGLVAFATMSGDETASSRALLRTGWILFGLCCLVFGAEHFKYEDATAEMVPKYLPLGQDFWARFTGMAHIAAGLGILSGIRARLAAQMLTAMFLVFAVLVHAPLLFADPTSHLNWVMNAMNLCLTGAAWVMADSLRGRSMWRVGA
jgi:uncharacterized membrane protein